MNREILFRGKRATNGEWLYGDLLQNKCDDTTYAYIRSETVLRVDPSTVGQFTGLRDKNGVRVFEGDILRYSFMGKSLWAIVWTAERASFEAHNRNVALGAFAFTVGEVIGNVHDNPELLTA